MKVYAVVMMGMFQGFKEPFPVPQGGDKKGDGIFLIDRVLPFPNITNHRMVRRVIRQPSGKDVHIVSPCGQPRRLFKKHPLRAAQVVLNGNICYKKNIHL